MKNFLDKLAITTSIFISFGITDVKAAVLSVTNNNSSISVENANQNGLFEWLVDGVDQMSQEWFWFRIGADGGEKQLNTLGLSASGTLDNTITLQYTGPMDPMMNPMMKVDVKYTLDGGLGGSGNSKITENVTITNLTSQMLDLHWFNYTDLEVKDTKDDDTASTLGTKTIQQFDLNGGKIDVSVTSASTPRWEISAYPTLLNALNDGNPTTLTNATSPFSTPADITQAFQYDVEIVANGSFSYEKVKIASIPEPLTILGAATAAGFGAFFKREINKKKKAQKDSKEA